jgi:hypothetical protein
MRALVSRVQFVVAILVAMLAAGNSLPGIAHALGDAAAHVCTCASGGDHAACPVCNPKLTEPRRAEHPTVDGVPCGSRRFATAGASEVTTLPSPLVAAAARVVRLDAPRAQRLVPEQALLEPMTPPPRDARA